ncbi:flavin-containing amine oxidoreductase-domain containing protein [Phlyctochytrium arcticum]|nr:flavin-containing amine oxidoreductase-domain containing protein [Phlyctochytrium arcticum]
MRTQLFFASLLLAASTQLASAAPHATGTTKVGSASTRPLPGSTGLPKGPAGSGIGGGQKQPDGSIRTKVLILGAGVSGIAAARSLVENNIEDFLVLEARPDVIGGRVHDIQWPPKMDNRVEIGANWIEGVGDEEHFNPIEILAAKHNLTTTPTEWTDTVFRDAKGPIDAKVVNATVDRFNQVLEDTAAFAAEEEKAGNNDMSLRTGYVLQGWQPETPFEELLEWQNFDFSQAERPDVSSLQYTGNMAEFGDGNSFVVDKRGYKHLFEAEAEEIGLQYGSPRLHLGKTVTSVQWGKDDGSKKPMPDAEKGATDTVTVKTSDGTVYVADYVLTTFSVGVLQHKDVKFVPQFPPWKVEAIQEFHMATYMKIFLNFPTQFWDDNEFTFYADNRRGYYPGWMNLNAKPYNDYFPKDSNVFFVTVTDEEAFRIERQSDDATISEITELVRKMYGPETPAPTDWYIPRWHSDPLFRGTFTNWPIGEVKQEFENLRAPVGRVWFTGEHTHLEYFGYVHGAWLSGKEMGKSIAECVKGKCPTLPKHTEVKAGCASGKTRRFAPTQRR